LNDILLTSDHPFRSILRISRGSGYAQYGGFPVIIESEFHISQQEYNRRCMLPWPQLPGSFLPRKFSWGDRLGTLTPPNPSPGPLWSEEVIGSAMAPLSETEATSLASLFEEMQKSTPPPAPRRRRKRS
jgi:hypothetical protein